MIPWGVAWLSKQKPLCSRQVLECPGDMLVCPREMPHCPLEILAGTTECWAEMLVSTGSIMKFLRELLRWEWEWLAPAMA